MKISRAVFGCAAIALSAIAASQTLPPPSYNGQSYWFGPGPAAYSLTSSQQFSGGYAEQINNGSSWVAGVSGGPAFVSTVPGGGGLTSSFVANTEVTVNPYIYIDGYFGLQASIAGYTGGSTIDAGSSRFYVIHNVTVVVITDDFSMLAQSGGSPVIPVEFEFDYSSYGNPGALAGGGSIIGGGDGVFTLTGYPVDTGGILEVSIKRRLTPASGTPAGLYTATGNVRVSAM